MKWGEGHYPQLAGEPAKDERTQRTDTKFGTEA